MLVEQKIKRKFEPVLDMVTNMLCIESPRILNVGLGRKYVIALSEEDKKPIRIACCVRGEVYKDIAVPDPILEEDISLYIYGWILGPKHPIRVPHILRFGKDFINFIEHNSRSRKSQIKHIRGCWSSDPDYYLIPAHIIPKHFWIYKSDRGPEVRERKKEELRKRGFKSLREGFS